ncbi:MAG: DUF6600 domain-containing protein [Burkholderiaceae bacterium]
MNASFSDHRVAAVPRLRGSPRWRAAASAGLLAAACLCGAGARADEEPPGRIARAAEVSGDVRTVDAQGEWVTLPRNQPLSTGDRVITGKEGRATIEIGSSTVRIGPVSDLSIRRLDDQKIFLHFSHGQMALRARSADILGELAVDTDEGVWVPRHPGHFRFDRAPRQVLAVQAWSGDLLLEAPDSSLPVGANQRAEVWREGPRAATHSKMVAPMVDDFANWALARNGVDDRDASVVAAALAQGVPLEMTGASDLVRYGQWSDAPGFGSVWMPDAVPSGWAPYQDGFWTWIAPWGWTWVDDSPWGFAPFHYGRWVPLHGRWAWTPGHWSGRPVYAPALVGWLGGAGFALDGAPAIGWVALAPDELFFPGYAVSSRYWSIVNNGRTPPARRLPESLKGRTRFVPAGPVAYANVGAPDAVAVIATASLLPRAPVGAMRSDRRRSPPGAMMAKAAELPPPGPPAGRAALAAAAEVVPVSRAGAPASAGVPAIAPPSMRTTPISAPASTMALRKPAPPAVPVPPSATSGAQRLSADRYDADLRERR